MKRGKGVTVLLIASIFLLISVSFASANWFTDLFNIGEDSDLEGELYSIGSNSLIAHYSFNKGNTDEISGFNNLKIIGG